MKKLLLIAIAGVFAQLSFAQNYHPHGGIYSLTGAGAPTNPSVYTKPFVKGITVRAKWNAIEISEGNYNWTYLDNEINKARANGKYVSLYIFCHYAQSTPNWVFQSGADSVQFIDVNPNHSTYLDTLKMTLPWDTIYLNKLTNFWKAVGMRYANDTIISYVQNSSAEVTYQWGFGGGITLLPGQTWIGTYGYTSDTLLYAMKRMLDVYMNAFPNTPEWVEIGPISFDPKGNYYVTNQIISYGFTKYPSRFNLWREELNACLPLNPGSGYVWSFLWANPCRSGGEMVWSVQDGADCTFRMSGCDTTICSKDTVLWRAIKTGLGYKLPYQSIYQADIIDVSLAGVLQQGANSLVAVVNSCNGITPVSPIVDNSIQINIYPNPMSQQTTLQAGNLFKNATLTVYNCFGQTVKQITVSS
jgi:hypothetical protein